MQLNHIQPAQAQQPPLTGQTQAYGAAPKAPLASSPDVVSIGQPQTVQFGSAKNSATETTEQPVTEKDSGSFLTKPFGEWPLIAKIVGVILFPITLLWLGISAINRKSQEVGQVFQEAYEVAQQDYLDGLEVQEDLLKQFDPKPDNNVLVNYISRLPTVGIPLDPEFVSIALGVLIDHQKESSKPYIIDNKVILRNFSKLARETKTRIIILVEDSLSEDVVNVVDPSTLTDQVGGSDPDLDAEFRDVLASLGDSTDATTSDPSSDNSSDDSASEDDQGGQPDESA